MGSVEDNSFACHLRGIKETAVAGYELSESNVFFVRPVENGAIVTDNDAAVFYAAYYGFNNCDDAMEADLNTKLSGIYGTPENITDESGKHFRDIHYRFLSYRKCVCEFHLRA